MAFLLLAGPGGMGGLPDTDACQGPDHFRSVLSIVPGHCMGVLSRRYAQKDPFLYRRYRGRLPGKKGLHAEVLLRQMGFGCCPGAHGGGIFISGHLPHDFFHVYTFYMYEPGIHYSQIQMQSGTTGINRGGPIYLDSFLSYLRIKTTYLCSY